MAIGLLMELALVTGCLAWSGDQGKALSFQSENQLTSTSHASLLLLTEEDSTTSSVSDLSVCAWIQVLHFRESTSYVFSYATSDKENNELNLGIKSSQIFIAIGGTYLYGRKRDASYVPKLWYHICVVVDHRNRTGTFYVNGERHRLRSLSRRHILVNGSLVLGQETDKVNGGYMAEQAFSGLITAFNLYSRPLSEAEVRSLASCGAGDLPEGDLVAWSTAQWVLEGHVLPVETPEEEYCSSDRFDFVVVPRRWRVEEAKFQCAKMKSTLALPRRPEDDVALYKDAFLLLEKCQPPNHATSFFWLGAYLDRQSGAWIDTEGLPLNYSNFGSVTTSSGKSSCAGYHVPPLGGQWTQISCRNVYQFCAACQERRAVVFRMRGLCEEDLQSTYFRIEQQRGHMPSFRGFTKYYLSYENNTWSLLNMWTGEVIADNFTYASEMPFGRRLWRVVTNFALCDKPKDTLHELSLSACHSWEYTCGEGTCVDLRRRCDLRVDCPDHSDETGCEKLTLPRAYLDTLPPPGIEPGPLDLNLSVSIHGFSEINIRDMKVTVDFSTLISWYDQRLGFRNLKPLTDLNYIKASSVWTPKLELVNADFPSTHTTEAMLKVVRSSKPQQDDAQRPTHDEVYEGRTNSLQLIQKVNAPFSCAMDLRNFPFDTQRCLLKIRLSSASSEFLSWHNTTVAYLGEVLLTEYEVLKPRVRPALLQGYSTAWLTIGLHRRYGYYITSAYLPTIMLMLISYASLFCRRESRDLRVMMSITILLVLYALYQQMSESLPPTSYTKAIDVWCSFAITFIFSQVIFHVAIDVKFRWPRSRLQQSPRAKGVEEPQVNKSPASDDPSSSSRSRSRSLLLHLTDPLVAARVVYACVFILFCVAYWSVVLSNAVSY